jgi:hypothetical protein
MLNAILNRERPSNTVSKISGYSDVPVSEDGIGHYKQLLVGSYNDRIDQSNGSEDGIHAPFDIATDLKENSRERYIL